MRTRISWKYCLKLAKVLVLSFDGEHHCFPPIDFFFCPFSGSRKSAEDKSGIECPLAILNKDRLHESQAKAKETVQELVLIICGEIICRGLVQKSILPTESMT
ncbi:hypothetical protein CEXT_261951 [Caerostris extrusa]|uniref:Uncharacterized protein n=1 Tax=Caerostris extrusa TaxID=172846 RepID=A0AAV4SZN9_CAEEX|nr:hypothetical protein CEXT_261951 [Caerostris extrusa]